MNLSEINYYPLKSGAKISPQSAYVHSKGIECDRAYMLVEAKGKEIKEKVIHDFISQRKDAKLANIISQDDRKQITFSVRNRIKEEFSTFSISLGHDLGNEIFVRVLGLILIGVDQGDDAAEWFSKYLERDVRLVYAPKNMERVAKKRSFIDDSEIPLKFADGYPFLITSTSSLKNYNNFIISEDSEYKAMTMNRFRPNLVIDGLKPFHEYEIKELQIGNLIFEMVEECGRCPIPSVDQETGEFDRDAKETLQKILHWQKEGFSEKMKKASFGINARLVGQTDHSLENILHVGDSVKILSRK